MADETCLTVMMHVHCPAMDGFSEQDFERLFRSKIQDLVGFRVKEILVIDPREAMAGLLAVLELEPTPIEGNGKQPWPLS